MNYECLVCGKTHAEECCPRCGFEVVEIFGDYEEGIRNLRPVIENHLSKFHKAVAVGIEICLWKDDKGTIVLDRKEQIDFGNVEELLNKEYWIDRKFARIPERKELDVVCYVRNSRTEGRSMERKITAKLPNLLEAELQQIGIRVVDGNSFVLLLKNDSGKTTESEVIALFDD